MRVGYVRCSTAEQNEARQMKMMEEQKVEKIFIDNYRLKAKEHPNPNYLYTKLLLQGLTRVREKLALIIVGDLPLFDSIIGIITPKQSQ